MKKRPFSEQFCHDILNSTIKRAKALVNIILALGSSPFVPTPVWLSLSPLFQYHYSIIGKVMKDFGHQLHGADSAVFKSDLRKRLLGHLPFRRTYQLSTDFTTIRKSESPTLSERGFVNIPNVRIFGNKPIDIGYYISCVNLHLYDDDHPSSWSLPLDNLRVEADLDKIGVAVEQLSSLLRDEGLPFGRSEQVVNTADTGYTVPEFISPLIDKFDNLLLINRLRFGSKVYKPYTGAQKENGRTKTYEDKPYYLQTVSERSFTNAKTKETFNKTQRPIFDLAADDQSEYEIVSRTGRPIIVQLTRWNDLLLRGKNDYKMDDKPFDLVCIRFIDKQTAACLFQRDMYVGVWGKNRHNHTTKDIQTDYKHRYDIEPHNRFSKQQLLADKYQTSNVQSLDAWLYTVMITFWLLYYASKDTQVKVQPWEQYLPQVKEIKKEAKDNQKTRRKSVALTKKGAHELFVTFDKQPFAPQKSKNGKGRKKGAILPKKVRHKPMRKNKNQQNNKQNIEKIE